MTSEYNKAPIDKAQSQTNAGTTVSQSAVDIKLVAIPESAIKSLGLDDMNTKQDGSEKQRSWMGEKFKKYKEYQIGTTTRFVRMPVNEYEMYWARDEKGHYCGTEPEGCEESKRLLKERLQDEQMQSVGKKNVSDVSIDGILLVRNTVVDISTT